MKIGTCKIGNTVLDIVDVDGVHRFAKDPFAQAIHDNVNLNGLHLEVLLSQESDTPIPIEDYLVYSAKTGYSWCGLLDVESSMVEMNPRLFPNSFVDGEFQSIIGDIERTNE